MATETLPWAAALGRLPSGIFILTVGGDGETGMLASWVQQCSFDPPRITVAINTARAIGERLGVGARFILNVVPEGHTKYIRHFGKGFEPGEPAFEGLTVDRTASAPILVEALAFLELEVVERVSAGDHDVIIAGVVGGRMLDDGRPMVHIRKTGLHY